MKQTNKQEKTSSKKKNEHWYQGDGNEGSPWADTNTNGCSNQTKGCQTSCTRAYLHLKHLESLLLSLWRYIWQHNDPYSENWKNKPVFLRIAVSASQCAQVASPDGTLRKYKSVFFCHAIVVNWWTLCCLHSSGILKTIFTFWNWIMGWACNSSDGGLDSDNPGALDSMIFAQQFSQRTSQGILPNLATCNNSNKDGHSVKETMETD